MPYDTSGWGPAPPANYDDQPEMSDLDGQVLVFLGPQARKEEETRFGVRSKLPVEHLVVFNRGGEMSVYPDYGVWQKSLHPQISGPLTVGRLSRDGNAYVLEDIPEDKKQKVAEGLASKNLLPRKQTYKEDKERTYEQARREMEQERRSRDEDF